MSTRRDSGRVAGLWRYPASSLGGESMPSAVLERSGIAGDRLFGIVDTATGGIARPDMERKWHGAPRIAARLSGDGLEIRVPGGDWLAAPSDAADRAAGAFLGFDAAIRPFGLEPGLPAPRYGKAPIHLLTTASLGELKAWHPGGNPDPRRFRPNIVIDMPPVAGHFPETEWLGLGIAIGEVELTVTDPCRRCGFTMLGQDGFDYDPDILRMLVKRNRHNLGVYCEVTRPGTIRLGDSLRFLG